MVLNNNLDTIKAGEYVWCKYTATVGAVGTFSDFAVVEAPGVEIPTTGTDTPDGYFKFICTGEDELGCKEFMADRVIQTGISYDTLNEAGVTAKLEAGGIRVTLPDGGSKLIGFNKLTNPSTLPTGAGYGIGVSPDGVYVGIAHATTPFITIYKRSGGTFTKLANPDVLPTGQGTGVSFSPDGNYMSVAHYVTPFVTIYKRDGDTFTKLANPDVLPPSTSMSTSFSPDGNYMSVAHFISPFITIYKKLGDTFTKLANPSSLPASTGRGVAFSADSTYMAVPHESTPYITIYRREGDTFTKLANPDVLPSGASIGASFSTDGNYLSVVYASSPYLTIYKRSGDTFTKLPNPATLPAGTGRGVTFSLQDSYLHVAHDSAPFMTTYRRVGDTFSVIPYLNEPIANNSYGVATYSGGDYVAVACQVSPYIYIYSPTVSPTNQWDAVVTRNEAGLANNSEWNAILSCLTTSTQASGSVVARGGASVDKVSILPTSNGSGYRPYVIRPNVIPPSVTGALVPDGVYLYENDTVNFGTVAISDPAELGVCYKVEANGVAIVPFTVLAPSPVVTSPFSISSSDLVDGNNTVTLTAKNSKEATTAVNAVLYKDALTQAVFSREVSRTYAWNVSSSEGKNVYTTLATTAVPMKYRTGIASVTLGTATNAKVLVSTDGRITWKAYREGSWQSVDPLSISTLGMSQAEVAGLAGEWASIFTNNARVDFMVMDIGGDLAKVELTFEDNIPPQFTSESINSALVGYNPTQLSATLTKTAQDIRYRTVINKNTANEVVGEWSTWGAAPRSFEASFPYTSFVDGSNTIDVEVEDYFGEVGAWSENVTMSVHDAIITIDKPTDTVPKDTAYNFKFKIEPAFYGSSITRTYDGGGGESLGSGRVYTISVDKTVMADKDFDTISII